MKYQNHPAFKKIAALGIVIAGTASAIPALAQTDGSSSYVSPSNPPVTRPFGGRGRFSSSTIMMYREARQASTTALRIQKGQDRGDTLLDQRIASLNSLIARVQGMKFVSDSDKATLESSLNSEVSQLEGLKNQVNADTSTTSLRNDVSSITKSYRIYMLVQPATQITAAGDRILNIIDSLNIIVGKVNARLGSSTDATTQATLGDISAKLSDAGTQAQAAITEVSGLKPDNGDMALASSNTAALKDARNKLVAAEKDLQAVRLDVGTLVKGLRK